MSINIFKEDKISGTKYKNIKKIGNKMVEILAKNQNLHNSKFENLFKSKIFFKV